MIFTSQSGLLEPGRATAWDLWYRNHLAVMAAVPGFGSAQRLLAVEDGPPPSLAAYTVASAAVFDSADYLRVRGMGPWRALIDPRHYRRNLFDGPDEMPEIPCGGFLLVADREAPAGDGVIWLRAVGLDRSTAFRGIAVLPDMIMARRAAAKLGGIVALYRPVTARLIGRRG